MLVLSRKEQEEIVIGDGISIRVVRIRGNRVQLGITAADSIRIRRGDVQEGESDEFRDNAVISLTRRIVAR